MKKFMVTIVSSMVLCSSAFLVMAGQVSGGEQLFKRHCAVCHPDGGNIINPKKTLHKEDREKNNIKTPDDIIRTMRNPGPGMTMFDRNLIPDNNAHEIAEYILKTW